VDTGLPMLLLSQHSLDADGTRSSGSSVYRGDRYKFVAHLSRPGRRR